MIAVNQSVYGVAGTASVIATTIVGTKDGVRTVFAQGVLSDTAAAVYTAETSVASAVVDTIFAVNTSGSTVDNVQFSLGGTTYPITGKFSIGAYGWAVIPTSGLATIYTNTGGTPTVGMLAADGSVAGATGSAQVFTNGVTSNGNLTLATTKNIVTAGAGSSFGGAANQKISVYGATPIVQHTTAVAEAAFVENAGGAAVNVDSTFGGYTLQQVVKALQLSGWLA